MRAFRKKLKDTSSASAPSVRARAAVFLKGLGKVLLLAFCAAGTAALVKLSYPRVSHYALAWVALAPFVAGVVRVKKFWTSFFYSWFTAVLLYGGVFWWIYRTCREGGGMGVALSAAAWLGLSALIGLQFAAFGAGCFFLKKLKALFPVLAACGFVALEWLHQTVAFHGLGFPWFMLGYSQWNFPQALQTASLAGVYGVSFAVAFTGICTGYALSGKAGFKGGVFQLILAGMMFGGVYAYGDYTLSRRAPKALLSLNAAVMQPNIDQYKKWSPEFEEEIFSTLEDMGARLKERNVMLAVWPESAVPGELTEEPYLDLFEKISADAGVFQVVGSNVTDGGKQFVGAYVVSPFDESLQQYRKVKLVPFGEYIPLESLVRSVAKDVEVLGQLGAFTPGNPDQSLPQASSVPFGLTVCYESIFPQLWLRQNRAGAKFFVNVTNDAWFFDSDAPYQHLAVNTLRAVETGRPVLRAANTGISAVIDRFGRVRESAALNTRALITDSVPLPVNDARNFYTQWGDWFAWLCAALYFTLLVSAIVFAYE